jgi:endoglucanase
VRTSFRRRYQLLSLSLAAILACAIGGSAGGAANAAGATTTTAAAKVQLRVNQGGYLIGQGGQAFLMTSKPVKGAAFEVRRGGHLVASGRVGADRGAWNTAYAHTYSLDLPAVRRAGTYRLVVRTTPAVSKDIGVRTPASLFGELISDGVAFDQVQRDGGRVATAAGQTLHRKPSHLNDARASVYEWPTFDPDTDEITSGPPAKTGAVADVSGGWFDAGDYVKFTHTAAFADVVLLAAQRDLGRSAPASLAAEGRYGTDWLNKMWDPTTKTLHLQVGTGNGTADGSLLGDHDLWRLPQADESDTDPADVLAASHRPVFDAAPAGKPISPNLAGRVAAAFALAAQDDAVRDRACARREYAAARAVIALADTASPPDPLTTALPNDFYPESSWHDDLELGNAELALAAQRLHLPASGWLAAGAHWARQYVSQDAKDSPDTFNLYDTSALAHTDLARAMTAARRSTGLAVTRSQLISDLARQLRGAQASSAKDPFAAAGNVADFDVDSHTFGLVAAAGWFHSLTGAGTFDRLAGAQRGWVLGANAWGRSFMVGVGQAFPQCMQHQVANLSGSGNGRPPLVVGAVVNGPNGADNFEDGLGDFQDGMKHCSVGGLSAFDGRGSRYVDDVRSWQTDEPALDMAATAIAAAASQWSMMMARRTHA